MIKHYINNDDFKIDAFKYPKLDEAKKLVQSGNWFSAGEKYFELAEVLQKAIDPQHSRAFPNACAPRSPEFIHFVHETAIPHWRDRRYVATQESSMLLPINCLLS